MIIDPTWLLNNRVVEEPPKQVEVEIAYAPHEGGTRFELGGATWLAEYGALRIVANGWKDCGAFAARVLGLLPHTPVHAITTHFVFAASLEEWGQALPQLGEFQLGSGDKPTEFPEVRLTGVRELTPETRFQVTLTAREKKGVVVAVNLYRNVNDAAQARAFAASWSQDLDVAENAVKEMFKIEIYDNGNIT
jgi:hypothetical protein